MVRQIFRMELNREDAIAYLHGSRERDRMGGRSDGGIALGRNIAVGEIEVFTIGDACEEWARV